MNDGLTYTRTPVITGNDDLLTAADRWQSCIVLCPVPDMAVSTVRIVAQCIDPCPVVIVLYSFLLAIQIIVFRNHNLAHLSCIQQCAGLIFLINSLIQGKLIFMICCFVCCKARSDTIHACILF